MRDLRSIEIYIKIVELKGVSPAARALNIPRSTVSRQLSELELELGSRLIQRSTRSFGLTEAGSVVYREFCKIAEARVTITETLNNKDPSGVLRVTAPFSFALNMLSPLLSNFLAQNPNLTVSIDTSNRRVDVIAEDFDVAIRAGQVESSSLIGCKLGISPFIICASPAYLASSKPLLMPNDLAKHSILAFHHEVNALRSWTLANTDERITVEFVPRLASNDHMVLLRAAIDGVGVTCLPKRLCKSALENVQLVSCLTDWRHGEAAVYALYPSRRALSPKVRAFIDYLRMNLDFGDQLL